jgi:hypothetical protein
MRVNKQFATDEAVVEAALSSLGSPAPSNFCSVTTHKAKTGPVSRKKKARTDQLAN